MFSMSLSKFGGITIPFSVFYFLLNIPPTLLVYKYVGHRFTIFSVLQYSLTSLFTELLPTFPITSDMLLIAVFGGILGGLAISIALRADASSSGTDFIAIYASTKYNRSDLVNVMYFQRRDVGAGGYPCLVGNRRCIQLFISSAAPRSYRRCICATS